MIETNLDQPTQDVEALLFDVGGTVFDWKTAVTDAVDSLRSGTITEVDSHKFSEIWRKQSLMEIDEIANANKPWRCFDDVLQTSLDQALQDCDVESIDPTDRERLIRAWEAMPVWPEAPAGLARLRQKFFIAPHTILSLRVAAHSSKNAGLCWDGIITCDALRAIKPAPRSYQRALEFIGRPAENVCFVAAHPGDLRAAKAQGMKTAYVVARLHDWGDSYTDTGFSAEFDFVAESFTDLADQLGC